jgi:glycosyltransferase involved in cell wall biosynthesis
MVPLSPLIIVPAFNEQATVGHVVRALREAGHDVLVIDDGSSDETGSTARAAGARTLRLPVNLGVGGALRLGFREAVRAGYRVVVQCDADGQHDPEQIGELLDGLASRNLDLAIGSRFVRADGSYALAAHRRLAVLLLAWIASRAAGVPITDPSSGFRAIGPRLLPAFAREYPAEYLGDTVEALVEAGRAGYAIGEVSVTMSERQGGRASASGLAASWYVLRVLAVVAVRWRRRSPMAPEGNRSI